MKRTSLGSKIVSIVLIYIMIISSMMIIFASTNDGRSEIVIAKGFVNFIQSQMQEITSITGQQTRENLAKNEQVNPAWSSSFANSNPNNLNYNLWQFVIAGNFYPSYGDVNYYNYNCHGYYFTSYNTYIIPENATITKVWAEVVGKKDATNINQGWFSVSNSTLPTWEAWGQSSTTFSTSLNKNNTAPNIYNSTILTPYSYADYGSYSYWNITTLYNWTIHKIFSEPFYVWWNQAQNSTGGKYFDYVGLSIGFYSGTYDLPGLNPDIIIPDFTTNFYSITWVLILFVPAIAMNQFMPKIGFTLGMILMLIILTATQVGFIEVGIIGFAAIGIGYYKGMI